MKKKHKCVICRRAIPPARLGTKPNTKTCSRECSQFRRRFGPGIRRNRQAQSKNKCVVCPRTISPTRKRANPNALTCSWKCTAVWEDQKLKKREGNGTQLQNPGKANWIQQMVWVSPDSAPDMQTVRKNVGEGSDAMLRAVLSGFEGNRRRH